MTPEFSETVDPILTQGLDLIDRIERAQPITVHSEYSRIIDRINVGDHRFGDSEVWTKAKYALVAWLDEQMIDAPWEHSNWWENNVLERKYFHDRKAFDDFFPQAKRAAELPNKDALEVFYLCVILGFRGFYDRPGAAQKAERYRLPNRIEDWVSQTAKTLRFVDPPKIDAAPRIGDGAPPLEGKMQFFAMSALGLTLLVGVLAYFFLIFGNQ
jgi:type VI secretion system protein ImpK